MEPVKQASFERTYNASPATLWEAWTNPEELKQWWGPDSTSIPECEVDLRVGGRFYIVMLAGEALGEAAGTRWPMEATYTIVEPNSHLVYTANAWTEGQPKEDWLIDQVTEVSFTEEDGKTRMNVVATINSTGPKAGAAADGMQYGFNQQFDKLEKFLAK